MAPVGEIYFEPSWKKICDVRRNFFALMNFWVNVCDENILCKSWYDDADWLLLQHNFTIWNEMKKKWRKNNNEKTHTGKNTHLKNTTITHTHTHDTIYEYIQLWLWKYDELLNNLKNNPPDVVFWVFVTFNWKREFSMESTKRQCCKACLRIASVPKFEDF